MDGQIKLIKLKYERLFCLIQNCPFWMYLNIRKMEKEEIENIKRKAA